MVGFLGRAVAIAIAIVGDNGSSVGLDDGLTTFLRWLRFSRKLFLHIFNKLDKANYLDLILRGNCARWDVRLLVTVLSFADHLKPSIIQKKARVKVKHGQS